MFMALMRNFDSKTVYIAFDVVTKVVGKGVRERKRD